MTTLRKCDGCGEDFITDSEPGRMLHRCPDCQPRTLYQCSWCGDIVASDRKRKYCSGGCARQASSYKKRNREQ